MPPVAGSSAESTSSWPAALLTGEASVSATQVRQSSQVARWGCRPDAGRVLAVEPAGDGLAGAAAAHGYPVVRSGVRVADDLRCLAVDPVTTLARAARDGDGVALPTFVRTTWTGAAAAPLGTVRSRVARAREVLVAELGSTDAAPAAPAPTP